MRSPTVRGAFVLLGPLLLAMTACGASGEPAADADPFAADGTRFPADGDPFAADAAPFAPDGVDADGPEPYDAGGPSTDADPTRLDAARPGPDAAPLPHYCLPSCNGASDCDLGSLPYDADNYDCVAGACIYKGCISDDECQALGAAYRCRQPAGAAIAVCLMTCATAASCDQNSAPFDADNYDCVDNACVYRGCNSASECQTLGNYTCKTPPGGALPSCLQVCGSPSDCATMSAPFDADNYDCVDNACVYRGCNSTTECQSLGEYVCA